VVQLYISACQTLGGEVSNVILDVKSDHKFHSLSTHFIYTVLSQSHALRDRHVIILLVVHHVQLDVGLAVFHIYIHDSHTQESMGHRQSIFRFTFQVLVYSAQLFMKNVAVQGHVASYMYGV